MLDRLPLELLDHVLDLLPLPSTPVSASERSRALYTCCLVSKRVSERAFPLLRRDLPLQTATEFFSFVAHLDSSDGATWRRTIRSLQVRWGFYQSHRYSILGVLERFPQLREVYLLTEQGVDLAVLHTAAPSTQMFAPLRSELITHP
jgi:hypothetical protein